MLKVHHNPVNVVDPNDPIDLPIYMMADGFTPPEKGNYYLIAGDGVWMRKDSGLVHGFVKLNGLGLLPAFKPNVGLRIPKIPVTISFQALMFFRYIYHHYRSEAILLLVYSPEKKAFALVCPPQTVGGSNIKYELGEVNIDNSLNIVGTWHSHCGFGSFHSPTDRRDESVFDGLHVTIGHVDTDEFSITSSIAINNNRDEVDPVKYLSKVHQTYGGGFSSGKRFRFLLTRSEIKSLNRQHRDLIVRWGKKVIGPVQEVRIVHTQKVVQAEAVNQKEVEHKHLHTNSNFLDELPPDDGQPGDLTDGFCRNWEALANRAGPPKHDEIKVEQITEDIGEQVKQQVAFHEDKK